MGLPSLRTVQADLLHTALRSMVHLREEGRIEFTCCFGLPLCRPMLPTPPHGEAVSVDYRIKLVLLAGTFTQQIEFTGKRTERVRSIPGNGA